MQAVVKILTECICRQLSEKEMKAWQAVGPQYAAPLQNRNWAYVYLKLDCFISTCTMSPEDMAVLDKSCMLVLWLLYRMFSRWNKFSSVLLVHVEKWSWNTHTNRHTDMHTCMYACINACTHTHTHVILEVINKLISTLPHKCFEFILFLYSTHIVWVHLVSCSVFPSNTAQTSLALCTCTDEQSRVTDSL